MTEQKTCFVLIGTGTRTDFRTGRRIDLDKTFQYLIKPVFEEMGMICLREYVRADHTLHERIRTAGFVVADVFAMEPETLYRLAIRHELHPHTTLTVSENSRPDGSSADCYLFSPDPQDVTDGAHEISALKAGLKATVTRMLEQNRRHTENPDPASTGAVDMFAANLFMAENALRHFDFEEALALYENALRERPDHFLLQRTALCTYLAKLPDETQALYRAQAMLLPLYTQYPGDPETCGLLGGIHKRLYHITREPAHLDLSLDYYEKGYSENGDHYNGVNAAFMHLLKSNTDTPSPDVHRRRYTALWTRMADLCTQLTLAEGFDDRDDRHWVYQSLAQAHYGLGHAEEYDEAGKMAIETSQGLADLHTFYRQNEYIRIEREVFCSSRTPVA